MWYMHDGAPVHSSVLFQEYLNQVYPNKSIRRGGSTPGTISDLREVTKWPVKFQLNAIKFNLIKRNKYLIILSIIHKHRNGFNIFS